MTNTTPTHKPAATLQPGDVIRHEVNTFRVVRLEGPAHISFYVHVIAECVATGQREALMYTAAERVPLVEVQ
jgi:hypothetical protein